MSVRIYVEGGGPNNRTKTECRRGFSTFFATLLKDRPKPRITACGSRDEAYRDFCRALKNAPHQPDALAILLVDSEGPIPANKTPSDHLRDRDKWTESLPPPQVHLMVQCMEAWFLADKSKLMKYYGQDFQASALPRNQKIEEIAKHEVLSGLKSATKACAEEYHKTRHAFEILASIDPRAVQEASPRAKRLFTVLAKNLAALG